MEQLNAPVYQFWNEYDDGTKYSIHIPNELYVVNGGMIALSQIPDMTYGITLEYQDPQNAEIWRPMKQVKTAKPLEQYEYRVDWDTGWLWLGGVKKLKAIRADYYGRGYWMIDDKRIFTNIRKNADGGYDYDSLGDLLKNINGYLYRGEWDSGTVYEIGNQVYRNGSTYIALKENLGVLPWADNPVDEAGDICWRVLTHGMGNIQQYDASKTYYASDLVWYKNTDADPPIFAIYECLKETRANNPGTNDTAYWNRIMDFSDVYSKPGKNMAGKRVRPTFDNTVTAGGGAEIFNDYRERTYNGTTVTAGNVASGKYSHAEGIETTASGNHSHAEGSATIADGYDSHAEGGCSTASGERSHAEGYRTMAIGDFSHSEGSESLASGYVSHAEGFGTAATGDYDHAEGSSTIANGHVSHAEGASTRTEGYASHSEGTYTIAAGDSQHVQGKYNIEDYEDKYAHIVGNGTDDDGRSNAHTLDWDGNAWFQGDVMVGSENDVLAKQKAVDGLNTALTKKIAAAEKNAKNYTNAETLTKTNTESYTPTKDYHPATKMYVDKATAKLRTRMTVEIDLSNSNPNTALTYADDAKTMTPGSSAWDEFFGHYPVLLKDGQEVGRLDPNDFSKFENGTPADITSGEAGDVMICFPIRGLDIYTTGNIMTVSMTPTPNPEFDNCYAHMFYTGAGTSIEQYVCDKFYLGSYAGTGDASARLRSLSGGMPMGSRTLAQMEDAAYRRQPYSIMGYYQLLYIQAMYLLKYKNLDSQTAVGRGYVLSNTAIHMTGGRDADGMDCGDATGKTQVKLFGLEDFWGNMWQWVGNAYADGFTEKFRAFPPGGEWMEFYSRQVAACGGYMSRPFGDSLFGFTPEACGGSSTTWFCDQANVTVTPDNNMYPRFGGAYTSGSTAGIFNLQFDRDSNASMASLGARLMYLKRQ